MTVAVSEKVNEHKLAIPATMQAAVYRGDSLVDVETIATPVLGPGEILIRVEACGVCHTDLKKVEYNLLPPPRQPKDPLAHRPLPQLRRQIRHYGQQE